MGDIAKQYSVVITKQQERRLQGELTFAFWSAWVLLSVGYMIQAQMHGNTLAHPDRADQMLHGAVKYMVGFGFVITNTIASAVCRVWHRDSTYTRVPWKQIVCHTAGDLCIRLLFCFFVPHFVS